MCGLTMTAPFLPNLFPPRPPNSNQNQLPPQLPNPSSWRPPNFPPFPPHPPGMFDPHFHPPPYGSIPPFMGPPDFSISGTCNMFPWRHPMSCDPIQPMGFQPRRGLKRGWGHSRGSGGPNVRKKLPAIFECKPCSKEYRTEETYKIHLQSHVKCSKCDFEGSGRALKEHELIHLLPDVLKFSSEEDIKKWREERRKNFPTAENIARKKQLAQEKKERGQSAVTPLHRYIQHLIGDDSPGSSRGGRRGRGRGRGCGRGRGRAYNQRGRQRQIPSTESTLAKDRDNTDQSGRKEEEEKSWDDVGCVNKTDPVEYSDHDGILNAIFADCAAAKSAGVVSIEVDGNLPPNSGDKANNEVNPVDGGSTLDETVGLRKRVRDDDSLAGRSKKQSKWASRKQNKRNKKKALTGLKAVTGARKPTLLEKLLAPEIRREENALLQCIRHVVMNNFFIEPKHPKPQTEPGDKETSCENMNMCAPSPKSHDKPVLPHNSPKSCDKLSQSCDSPLTSFDNPYQSCDSIQQPSVNAIYEHSHSSPDRPVSSSEPPDRSHDILY